MTTAQSPLRLLKAQADKIAMALKAAERGEKIDVRWGKIDMRFVEKIAAARGKESFKFGIVMDDKTVVIEIPWASIRRMSETELAMFILAQMRAKREVAQ